MLGVDAAQAKQGTRHVRAPVRRGDDILLMSDGFAALIDAYAVYDAPALVSRMAEAGLAALGRELRQIERDDAACLRRVYRQRLKYFEGPPHYAYSEHAE